MMTPEKLIEIGLSKKGAYLDYPFGPETAVIKVGKRGERPGRIFVQAFKLKGRDTITLNCGMMEGEFYRRLYPGVVVRGYHCPPVQQSYFNTLPLDGSVEDSMIMEMLEHSYKTVVEKLPKYIQKELARE